MQTPDERPERPAPGIEEASQKLREAAGEARAAHEDALEAGHDLGRRTRVGARMAGRKVKRAAGHAREQLADTGEWTRERLREGGQHVREGVRERPLGALAIAAGVGLALGALLARRHH